MSPGDIASAASLIRAHHVGLAVELFGADAVSPETIAAAVKMGVLTVKDAAAAGVIAKAFEHGVAKLTPRPLTTWEMLRSRAARQLGAMMVVGLGDKAAHDFSTGVMAAGNASGDDDRRRLVATAVGYGLDRHLTASQVRSLIGTALGDDWTRDVGRIASTEIQRAVNAGYGAAVRTDFGGGAGVAVIPNPDACQKCRSAYLDGGKPKVMRLDDLPPPEVNFGATTKVVTMPPLHPWCHCQLVHVPSGWRFGDDWSLSP